MLGSRTSRLTLFPTRRSSDLVLFSLALGNLALGQSTAVLKGTVTDALGAAIPHAKVVAKNQVTGAEWNTESDNVGSYLVPEIGRAHVRTPVTWPSRMPSSA